MTAAVNASSIRNTPRCWGRGPGAGTAGDDVYQAQYLGTGDPLYVIGQLRTLRGADGTLDPKADRVALLWEWKSDRQGLLQRFDANRDGDIDMREWQQVVAEAGREVAERHQQLQ